MKAPPDEVKLSREEGQALIERLQANALTSEDRGLLVKLIQVYFWFTFALSETKISLSRLKRALFGEGRRPPPAGGAAAGLAAAGGATPAPGSPAPTEGPPARDAGGGAALSSLWPRDVVSATGRRGDADRR